MKDKIGRLTPAIEREIREAHMRRERRQAVDLATRFSKILENSSDEIYIFDGSSLHFVQANSGALRNLGYTMEELARMTPLDLMPELSDAHLADLLQPLRRGSAEQQVFETVHRRKNGSIYPVEVRLYCDVAETQVCATIVLDISGRKDTERALQETRDAEQSRIADKLHDTVFRKILAISESLEVTQTKVRDADLSAELGQEISDLRQAMQSLRYAVYDLRLSK